MLAKALSEYRHLFGRLLVAFAFRHLYAILVGALSVIETLAFSQRAPIQLPCRGVIRIERDCLLEMICGGSRISGFEIFVAEAETQQRAIAAGCKHALKFGDGVGIHAMG